MIPFSRFSISFRDCSKHFSFLIRPRDFVTCRTDCFFFSIVICAHRHSHTMDLMHLQCIEPDFHCIWCRELEDFEQNHSIWLTQCGIWHTNFCFPSIFTTYPRDLTIANVSIAFWAMITLHTFYFPFSKLFNLCLMKWIKSHFDPVRFSWFYSHSEIEWNRFNMKPRTCDFKLQQ